MGGTWLSARLDEAALVWEDVEKPTVVQAGCLLNDRAKLILDGLSHEPEHSLKDLAVAVHPHRFVEARWELSSCRSCPSLSAWLEIGKHG